MKISYRDVDVLQLPPYAQNIIEEILKREGGEYTDHPDDWPTKWGIRKLSADRASYEGPIQLLTRDDAAKIWVSLFWFGPNLHKLGEISHLIAETVIDTGGPAGIRVGVRHLQKALTSFNMLNKAGYRIYGDDLTFDGLIGQKTIDQLKLYFSHRREENILASRLNCLQDAHYVEVALAKPEKRSFSFGWSSKRVFADLVDIARQSDRLIIT